MTKNVEWIKEYDTLSHLETKDDKKIYLKVQNMSHFADEVDNHQQ